MCSRVYPALGPHADRGLRSHELFSNRRSRRCEEQLKSNTFWYSDFIYICFISWKMFMKCQALVTDPETGSEFTAGYLRLAKPELVTYYPPLWLKQKLSPLLAQSGIHRPAFFPLFFHWFVIPDTGGWIVEMQWSGKRSSDASMIGNNRMCWWRGTYV